MADGDLTTLDNVKAWLPDMAQVTASDALLARLITAASQAVCVYTGRAGFGVQDFSEVYDGARRPSSCCASGRRWRWTGVGVADGSAPSAFSLEPAVAGGGSAAADARPGRLPPRRLQRHRQPTRPATPPPRPTWSRR